MGSQAFSFPSAFLEQRLINDEIVPIVVIAFKKGFQEYHCF